MGSYLVVVRQDTPRIIGDGRLIGNKEFFLFLSRSLTIRSARIEEQSLDGLYLMIAACNCYMLSMTADRPEERQSHTDEVFDRNPELRRRGRKRRDCMWVDIRLFQCQDVGILAGIR